MDCGQNDLRCFDVRQGGAEYRVRSLGLLRIGDNIDDTLLLSSQSLATLLPLLALSVRWRTRPGPAIYVR
jgi:hypothetical protein